MSVSGLYEPVTDRHVKGASKNASERPAVDKADKASEKSAKAEKLAAKTNLRTGSLTEKTDGELVGLVIKGDSAAYGELVGRHQLAARNMARSIVRDFQTAEDLAQDAFIKAYSSLSELKEPEKFGGWMLTILRHAALDQLRSTRSTVSLETLQEEGFELREPAEPVASAALEHHEDEQRVLAALSDLRDDYREIIVLKHVEKLSYKEIATRLDMSVSAVGEKLSRVRSILKRCLEKKPISERRQSPELEQEGND